MTTVYYLKTKGPTKKNLITHPNSKGVTWRNSRTFRSYEEAEAFALKCMGKGSFIKMTDGKGTIIAQNRNDNRNLV